MLALEQASVIKGGDAETREEQSENNRVGLPCWSSVQGFASPCRGHGFHSWSWRIPHVVEPLSVPKPLRPPASEPTLGNQRSHHGEEPACHNQRKPARSSADPAQPKINTYNFLKRKETVVPPWGRVLVPYTFEFCRN